MGALWGAAVGGAQDLTDVILSASLSSMAGGGGEDASASGNDLGPTHQCTDIEKDVDKNFFDLSGMCDVAKNPDRCFVMDSDECVPGICCADHKCVPDCVTLSGGFAAFIQVMCLFMGITILLVKKNYYDKGEKREWKIWLMDVGKQGASGACCHAAGLLNGSILEKATRDAGAHGNQCSWYFISFSFDTTLGMGIAYVLLQAVQQLARTGYGPLKPCPSLVQSGNYQRAGIDGQLGPADCGIWIKQLTVWCMINVVARAFCGVAMYILSGLLRHVSELVASPFCGHHQILLTLVMLGGPIILNGVQLWVQDTFLRKGKSSGPSSNSAQSWLTEPLRTTPTRAYGVSTGNSFSL